MVRTINEVIAVIGRNIEDIQDTSASQSQREITMERAQATAMLAKQFINAASLIQKADKMTNRHDRTDVVIG